MKNCNRCGNELNDNAIYCPKCNEPTDLFEKVYHEPSRLQKAAKIIMAIFTVIYGITALVTLLMLENGVWAIAFASSIMFIVSFILASEYGSRVSSYGDVSVLFKVLILIFSNAISGIMILAAGNKKKTDEKHPAK